MKSLAFLAAGVALILIASPLSVIYPKGNVGFWPMLSFVSILRVGGLACVFAAILLAVTHRGRRA